MATIDDLFEGRHLNQEIALRLMLLLEFCIVPHYLGSSSLQEG